jgi:acetyl-CoA carboxylase biotin carboxyl carrier protein
MNVDTQAPQPAEDSLESLCKQARVLATGLPGALTKLTVMVGQNRVEVEWLPVAAAASPLPAGSPAANGVAAAAPAVDADATMDGHAIVAPLVGTVYLGPKPDDPPFVAEGDLVEAGQQVAIVEAMKIMNAVQADQAGRVVKVLVTDTEMVEYGQRLMIIQAADAEA